MNKRFANRETIRLAKPRRGAVVVISQRLADAKPPFLPNRAGRRWCASAYAATSKIIALQAIAAVYRGVRRYGGTASALAANSPGCKGFSPCSMMFATDFKNRRI